jgi:hypothetical protein
MNRPTMLLVAILCLTSLSAQEVETTADGQHLLHLTNSQQSAVDLFLKDHPNLKIVNCPMSGPDAAWCRTSYANWQQTVLGQHAKPQYPFAAWGDFRGKGTIDLAMPFHVGGPGNGAGANRGEIVVFEEISADHYKPQVVLTDSWGGCFDGILFHPVRKQIEFWCNTMSGFVRWDGATFIGKIMKGD